jgi:DNA replication protein DnaC
MDQAFEARYQEYMALVAQRVTALHLGPLQDHEKKPTKEDFWKKNTIVVGPVGTGKTSLLRRIAYHAVLAGYRVRGGYVIEILSNLKDPQKMKPLMSWLESGNMLILDDIDKSLGTQYELDRLLLLVDRYWVKKYPVITSMNLSPEALEKKLSTVRGLNFKEEAKALLSRLKAQATQIVTEGPDLRQQGGTQ